MRDPSLPDLHGSEPRKLGGDIAGPGGPHDRDGVVVDTTNAVLLDFATVSMIETLRAGQEPEVAAAIMLEGRVNKSTDRTRVVYVVNADGVAALVTELMGLATRAGSAGETSFAQALMEHIDERWGDMPK